jgi:hypothetical protein
MSKRGKIIAALVVFFAILFVSSGDEPLDWSPEYNESGTKPLDLKIFFDEFPALFQDQPVRKVFNTFYEYKSEGFLDTLQTGQNYISISNKFRMDKISFNELLTFIGEGNTAFLSAGNFPSFVKDTLNFRIGYDPIPVGMQKNRLGFFHSDAKLNYESKLKENITFIKDSTTFRKLGFMTDRKEKKQINFMAVPFRKGMIYIHTSPEIFTNYQLLEAENTNYINTLISYLPEAPVYFNLNIKQDPNLTNSPLRFILSQPALKWAWYLGLTGIGLFMYFNGKRRQRIIPEIPEKTNTTTEFVKTMSNLYHETEEYNNIIQKEITYFLEHVRNTYYLTTEKLDEKFIRNLALKSGNDPEEVRALVVMISKMRDLHFTTKTPLINLHRKIEAFYKK